MLIASLYLVNIEDNAVALFAEGVSRNSHLKELM
jgi:hypothetical protein